MEIYSHPLQVPEAAKHAVITIGNFDGFHLGHKYLISQMKTQAAKAGGKLFIITFDPHPAEVLRPETPFLYLQTREDLLKNLEAEGVQGVLKLPFDQQMASMSADEFYGSVIYKPFQPSHLFVGEDFAFGKSREGNLEKLHSFSNADGFQLHALKKSQIEGEDVSSSRIRRTLQSGDLKAAKKLLGRDFTLSQIVTRGDGRGKSIGVPTANLQITHPLALKPGVYVTTTLLRGEELPSVTNVGFNPTFLKKQDVANIRVETHVLQDELKDFYEEMIQLKFLKRLRDEMKFAGPKELVKKINTDKAQALEYFKTHGSLG